MNIMEKTRNFTMYVIPALIIFVFVYDFYAMNVGGTEASISWLLITSSYKYPVLPLGIGLTIGFILGHLFWRMRNVSGTDTLGK